MRKMQIRRGAFTCVLVTMATFIVLAPRTADASFHLWDVVEVYTNADGSVQYFELLTTSGGQTQTNGTTFRLTIGGVTFTDFTLDHNLTGGTAGQRLLIATPGYAALDDVPEADFVIPPADLDGDCGCFIPPDVDGMTVVITIVGALSMTLTDANLPLPTDGLNSANQVGGNINSAAASPTNLNGDTCGMGFYCPDSGSCTSANGGCADCFETEDCDDDDVCTEATCVDFTCNVENVAGSCDDGLFCTTTDACSGGECVGSGDACPGEVCNETSDACVDCVTAAICQDGDFCNGAERCIGGACEAGIDPCPDELCDEDLNSCVDCLIDADCDDDNVCTDDTCNESGVCEYANNTEDCDDGRFCTDVDTCSAGECVGSGDPCGGQNCNEGANTCEDCASPTDCEDGDPCTVESCVDGDCGVADAEDGTDCADETFCNGIETCQVGVCVAPGNPCDTDIERCVEAEDACALLCGNGLLNPLEECDDENDVGFDGCSAECEIEPGWDCEIGPPTVCASECGDGQAALGAEECDDDNATSDDGCSAECAVEDGWLCAPESEGGADLCEVVADDGLVRGDEECDDGNDEFGDGCFDGLVQEGFDCDDSEPSVCFEHEHDDGGVGDAPQADVGTPDAGGDVSTSDIGDDAGSASPGEDGCCRTAPAPSVPDGSVWLLALVVGLVRWPRLWRRWLGRR